MSQLSISYPGPHTPYAIIRRATDSFVWNGAAFVAFVDGDIASYDVALTNDGGDLWTAEFPSDIDAGGFYVMYYRRTGGTPTTSDLLLLTEDVTWNGATTDAGLPPTTQGRLISDVTLKAYGGTLNVAISSQQDPAATGADAANIGRAIEYAESKAESETARTFKLTTDVGLTWGDEPLLTSGSRSLPLIQEACHRLAMRRLNMWRMVQSLAPEQSVDQITATEESIALNDFADWRMNPEKLYEVDRTAATSSSAIQTAGGITAKTGALKCYPGTRENLYPYWRNRG